jgi:putative FmdB family regulatory protein
LALYLYQCENCGTFEAISPMPGKDIEKCPDCGSKAKRIIAPVNHTFGWRLSDASHERGHKDELVRDI